MLFYKVSVIRVNTGFQADAMKNQEKTIKFTGRKCYWSVGRSGHWVQTKNKQKLLYYTKTDLT